ncbi:hypothetical protein HRH25_23215 [Flavisolibacter sp. BT320]|nr:hypothetical protein [Flavisolibacter longurius]
MKGKKIIEQSFSVPIKQLHFHYGGVSCKKLVKELGKAVPITIINYDIREEFDAVKDYFANALGTKAVDISVRMEVVDGAVQTIEANSPQIAGINQDLIETVRFQFVKEAVKKRLKIEVEKNLLTMDEFFDALSEKKLAADTFYEDEKSLAEDLLSITETKHYLHLRHLSAKHAHHIMRLRFVLKPFSFIFLLEGLQHYHIVWETLDTEEATYVWPVEKDLLQLKLTLKKIEDIIQLVKVQGKVAYISSSAETYRRIFHHYKDNVQGFVKWKGELESMLT